jgi:hypothetical protein
VREFLDGPLTVLAVRREGEVDAVVALGHASRVTEREALHQGLWPHRIDHPARLR